MSTIGHPEIHSAGVAGRMLYGISRFLAMIGGILACAMAVLMSSSVAGRAIIGYPVPGDYEMTAVINGTAIFAFLPYCQMVRGNVVVDFFTARASKRTKAVLDAFGSLLYLAVGVLFTWRLVVGGIDMYKHADVTSTLSFPLWVTLPFDIICMAVLVLVTAYTFGRNIADVRAGGSGQSEAGTRAG